MAHTSINWKRAKARAYAPAFICLLPAAVLSFISMTPVRASPISSNENVKVASPFDPLGVATGGETLGRMTNVGLLLLSLVSLLRPPFVPASSGVADGGAVAVVDDDGVF